MLRRKKVPSGVRSAVPLAQGESVMAVARGGLGFLVATDRKLHEVVPDGSDFELNLTLRWDQIDQVWWRPPDLELALDPNAEIAGSDRLRLELDHRSDLPGVVRERVTRSIVVNELIPVAGEEARVVGRRNADSGEISWRIIGDAQLDMTDPVVQSEASQALSSLRVRLGI